jgi:hypothetical protein
VQSRGAAEARGRMALLSADRSAVAPVISAGDAPGARFSLLQASVPARLGIMAVVAAVLWLAVLWAIG